MCKASTCGLVPPPDKPLSLTLRLRFKTLSALDCHQQVSTFKWDKAKELQWYESVCFSSLTGSVPCKTIKGLQEFWHPAGFKPMSPDSSDTLTRITKSTTKPLRSLDQYDKLHQTSTKTMHFWIGGNDHQLPISAGSSQLALGRNYKLCLQYKLCFQNKKILMLCKFWPVMTIF